MAKKKLLQDNEGQIWPITTADCVYLSDGSKTVKKYIDDALAGKANSSHGTHLTLGTGSGNAYYGDKGKIAYDHSQTTHAPSNAQKNSDITKAEIEAKLTGSISTHTHSYAASSHTHTNIVNQDTRSANTTPDDAPLGLSVHLKSNGTDGLSDGGTYHSSLFIKGWNDYSGGPYGNIAISANNNLWFRSSSSGTAWNAWKKVSLDGHTHSNYLPLTGGTLSGKLLMTQNSEAIDASSPMQMGYEYLACYGNLKLYADTDATSGANGEYVHIATGSHQPSINSGLVVYRDYASCNNVQFTNGDIVLNNNRAIYGKVTDGGSRTMLRMTDANVVDVGHTNCVTCLLGSSNPKWWNGSKSILLAHTETKIFEGSNYKFGQGLYGTGDAGVASTTAAVTVQGVTAWIKRNNYYAGDGDRFINASTTATQLFLDGSSNKAQIRWSTNTPTADGKITWSTSHKIVCAPCEVTISSSAPSSKSYGDIWINNG